MEYGVVQQSQIISSQTRSHPLRTVAAGAPGGVVGHQFGNGKGQTAMTAAGAVAGAGVSRHRQSQQQAVQQVDGSLTFSQGDKVRVLTSGSNIRVDKSV
ncbi:glycine zipper 2TM domain-containing protein [Raoultella sp. BIGb0149]|uniref:glycine zipper 2TM domain-containing protein n=1 Tax=Raoultella sp. BIGb0149 TaxID=2485116 RepID=UPI001FB5C022|nr:glycine zipper 2TM domain-containing protein [Raoultella sp. BIGb0149]